MDPCQNIHNTRLQRFLQDQFEMLLQEVDNFKKTTVPAVQHSMDTTDLVKSFADYPMSSNNSNISDYALSEYNKLLLDFHELESTMIPLHQKDTVYDHNSIHANLTGTAQNPEATMEKKKAKSASTWGLNDAIGVAQTTDNIGCCGSTQDRGTAATMSTATYINSCGNGVSNRGGMFTSLVNFANVSSFGFTGSIKSNATSSISRIAAWRQGGVKEVPKHRHKRRRRYRGVYQTEEEARLKQERLKIKQRATSAEAYQKKKDYINRLEEQVQRLREQNKRLKRSLMVLTRMLHLKYFPSLAFEKQLTGKSASKTTEENVLRTHLALNLNTAGCYLETLANSMNT
ncbi:hypothetical protein POM88_054660 [Heracleum sosnowskyi]|uniref:BZIP domain-containing protein n=1 Tax=Heracleum sosnowskyi TaxID=360622 RepID=A0AAD8GN47_9APIA|nr:hypothetical protein POM88_054660 [Heracleum sosnowskyi]